MKKLVSLENLPSIFHINLDKKFRESLFEKARNNETWTSLSKKINYSRTRLDCLKRGYRTIHNKKEKNLLSVNLLKKLSMISDTSLQEIEKHIISIRVGRGRCYSLKLPICESPELASIVAHSLGDGHLRDRVFVYFNERMELIQNVKDNIEYVFGKIKPKIYYEQHNSIRIVFPSIISRILFLIGSVRFNKTLQNFDVPKWIKNGSKEIKASFIRGLFDDEASADIKQREIIFQMSNNKKFILSLLEILKEFRIQSTIRISRKYKDKNNNEKVMYGFTLGKFENLLNYKKYIGFHHLKKQSILSNILENFRNVHYLYENIEGNIINLLLNKESLTVKDLMKELDRSDEAIRVHLNNLYKKNLIVQINNYPSTWKIR